MKRWQDWCEAWGGCFIRPDRKPGVRALDLERHRANYQDEREEEYDPLERLAEIDANLGTKEEA